MAFDKKLVERIASQMRCDIIRMVTEAGSGHPGGSLSAVEIMATLYFGDVMRYRVADPVWQGRDRFILSKGHAAPVLYATLAQAGYLPREELLSLRKFGSRLQGHPDSRKLPGVEVSTGSLGQGLSIAVGLAAGLKLNASVDDADALTPETSADTSTSGAPAPYTAAPYVYTLLGDGELQEGQIWEAAMFAAHKKLDNLIAIVDNNNLQIDGFISEVNNPCNIKNKFESFNWRVICCENGHDVWELKRCFDEARLVFPGESCAPTLVVANTTKGKGVSFMENQCCWHGKAPSTEQCVAALEELAAADIRSTADTMSAADAMLAANGATAATPATSAATAADANSATTSAADVLKKQEAQAQ